jgi:hypothetical protein
MANAAELHAVVPMIRTHAPWQPVLPNHQLAEAARRGKAGR